MTSSERSIVQNVVDNFQGDLSRLTHKQLVGLIETGRSFLQALLNHSSPESEKEL